MSRNSAYTQYESVLTRRGFLIAISAAGAIFGFPKSGQAEAILAANGDATINTQGNRFEPSLWYLIDSDGKVNVNITRTEMGQHIGTSLARIVADELGAAWDDVQITYVDYEKKWGSIPTAGSCSVWSHWPIYRQAGAAGRYALIEAAAQMWGIETSECRARDGKITSGDKQITFGALVARGLSRSFTEDELKTLPLKRHSELSLVGQDVAALDIADKTTGKAVYGLDVKVDGMVYGVPIIPPTRQGSKVVSIDDSAAKDQKGYLNTIDLKDPTGIVPGMVIVVGASLMAAKRASKMIVVEWAAGNTADVSEDDIQNLSRKLIADKDVGGIIDTGNSDTEPAFDAATGTLEAEYTTSTVLHFTLEPMNATALRNSKGQYEIHAGSQWPALMEGWVQKALGLDDDMVVMHTHMVGGGFGRRVFGDYVVASALASKALDGKPIKLVFFREDDSLIDCPRSPSVQKLRMAFSQDGHVTGMEHSAAAGWPAKSVNASPDFITGINGEIYDTTALSGADHWYNVGAHKVRGIYNDLATRTVRSGFLRSTGPGWTSFAVESFMDEAANQLGVDPVEFRLHLLNAKGRNSGSAPSSVGGASRQADVLKRVVEMSNYHSADLGADTAIGIASTFGMEREMPTWTGTAVKLHVDRSSGEVQMQKIWLVIDCGTVIDPDGALAQCEGAALWGLSMALHEGTSIEDGRVSDRNLGDYTPLRMIDVPELEIELVESTEAPVGLGEPGVTGIGPAVANAIFNAVGVRLRHLPITSDAVLNAL